MRVKQGTSRRGGARRVPERRQSHLQEYFAQRCLRERGYDVIG
jgi:hypothetical protein